MNIKSVRARFLLDFFLIGLALMALTRQATGFFTPTDLSAWESDAEILAGCVAGGYGALCQGLSKFPGAYVLNSLLYSGSEDLLALMNIASLLLPVACLGLLGGWRLMFRGGTVYLLAIALSPLPGFYVRSGALEIQAGVISGIFIACLSRLLFESTEPAPSIQLRALLCASGVLLPLYKDTLVVVLSMAVFVVWLARAYRLKDARLPSPTRLKLLACHAAAPVVVGVSISLAYNMLRYDSLIPVGYMQEAVQTTPSLLKSAEFFIGSIISPNGGVVIFWALSLTFALFGWLMRDLRIEPNAVALVSMVALLSCLGFARWWAPFGWDSWGNRLMIQPMLAVLVVSLLSLRPLVPQRGSHRGGAPALFALPVIAASAYYMLVPYIDGRGVALYRSLWSGPACAKMLHRLQKDSTAMGLSFWRSDVYYQCARERMLYIPTPTQ